MGVCCIKVVFLANFREIKELPDHGMEDTRVVDAPEVFLPQMGAKIQILAEMHAYFLYDQWKSASMYRANCGRERDPS